MASLKENGIEKQLIIKFIGEGDREIYVRLFNMHKARVYTYAFALTECKLCTEEIILKVFLKVWDQKDILEADMTLEQILRNLIRNEVIEYSKIAEVDIKIREEAFFKNQNKQLN